MRHLLPAGALREWIGWIVRSIRTRSLVELPPAYASFERIVRNVLWRKLAHQAALQNAAAKEVDPETESYLRDHFCSKPFQSLETTPSGLVHVCCPGWLPTPIGKLEDGLSDLWKGRMAQRIRQSIVDGSFAYCSRLNCREITGRFLERRDSAHARAVIREFASHPDAIPPPKEITLSHDRSCNLSCPSCRKSMFVAGKGKQKKLDDLVEQDLLPILKRAERVSITGSGDPFGSIHFRRLIKRLTREEFPNLSIHLQTNGLLWDRRAWTDLDLAGRVGTAHISIDAAEEGTYSVLRRGGSFKRLLENLAFIKELRESGEIKYLMVSMVVQKLNFRQMPDFVRLGKNYAADEISFQMIRNWGTFSWEQFEDIYVGKTSHPDYPDLVGVLAMPELDWPGVDVGNVRAHARAGAAHA